MDEQAPEQGGDDPMQALGQAISAMAEGLSKGPPEVAKAAQAVMAAFQQLMSVMGGAGGGGQESAAGAAGMAGGNPNAQAVG